MLLAAVEEPAPTLLIVGQLGSVKETFIVAETQLVCKVKPHEAPLALLAAFYCYNMSYPKGLETFYMFLDYIILDKRPKKMSSTLTHFITVVSSM